VTGFQAIGTQRHDAYKLLFLSGLLVASRLGKETSAESRDPALRVEGIGAARAVLRKVKVIYHSEVA